MICDISIAAEDAQLGHPAGRSGGVSSMPLWQVLLGPKMARYLLFTGRLIDGKEAERIGLVSLAVPAEELETFVDQVAAEAAAIPHIGATFGKDALNMDLEIMGLSALFRYHGQMNAVSRLLKK
jgi:enoyl-CoA hydratase